jgi:cellulose synthase/poly-beta-1,6-N-acetylglucosamine synthase-like glycosyltransferase
MYLIVLVTCLWTCVAVLVYTYLGYPVLVWYLARCFARRCTPPRCPDDAELPSLSVLIAAYNEEAVIEARIQNALALDYPREKLEIVVASDGSSDRTAEIVRRLESRTVRLLDYRCRRGKAAALNSAFTELRGEVVMLSDANTFTEPGAARLLARWFRDERVGVVCGRLILTDPVSGGNVDSFYWKYETALKRCEGRLGALLGANGAIYAIRRDLFSPIPEGTILDDMLLPLQCRLRTGCGLVYDSEAVAHEESAPDMASEFRRRSRFAAGSLQCIRSLWRLLDPRQGWVALAFLSHKVLRWLCPIALVGLAVSNLCLWQQPFFRWLLAGQAAFYLVALVAAFLPGRFLPLRVLRLTTLFTSMNVALLVGLWKALRGRQQAAWRRTARVAEAAGG